MDDPKNISLEEVKGKGKRGLKRLIFGRTAFFVLFVALQAAVLFWIYRWLDAQYQIYGYGLFGLIGALLAVRILNEKQNASFKMAWLVVVLLFPVFGGLFYVFVQLQMETKRQATRIRDIRSRTGHYMAQNGQVKERMDREYPESANLCHYLGETCGFPVYDNTDLKYYPLGDDFYEELIPELEKAERFIFLEFFIITPGVMWDTILGILEKKAAEGVDVRVMYDGMNSFTSLPFDYPKTLAEKNIKCRVFNRIHPAISTSQNNRDHRKILVIDGHTAYTGGVNLADEYINRKVRFGHWKDNAIRLKGEAVRSFTVMFLQMWDVCMKNTGYDYNYDSFLDCAGSSREVCGSEGVCSPEGTSGPEPAGDSEKTSGSETALGTAGACASEGPCGRGYVIPYSDSPLDSEAVGHQVYLDIIYHARRYLYIMTPYLILDDDMITALSYAAKRGVDTVIVMPHIPDKKYAFMLAHTYYPELIEAGVKIYEYLPGFLHSKTFLSDDIQAVVGSINLDFRSQYLNFESAVYFCGNPAVHAIRADFEETLKQCVRMTMDSWKLLSPFHHFAGSALRLIAPLM